MPPVRKASRQQPSNRNQMRFLLLTTILLLLVTGIIFISRSLDAATPGPTDASGDVASTGPTGTDPTDPPASLTPTPPAEIRATLVGVGDIILHQDVIDGGLTNPGASDPVYDYTPIFRYIQPIIADADLAMANYEGTLAGPPYSGYPFFCAPDAIADALWTAGFRAVWTANNHTIDKGLDGVIRTATVFRDRGFQVVGTRPDETEPADAVLDVNGIRVGVMAYTFETPGSEGVKTLNGNVMPAAADPLIDSFNPYRETAFEQDLDALLARAAALRGDGAEIICLSLHWGEEYSTRSCEYQRTMAQRLCDAGIELIIGHHPHVIEEVDVLTSSSTGRPTLVYYSVGNFVHNMDYITHGTNGKAQDAIIARVTLLKTAGGVVVEKGEYIPTYVVRVPKGSERQHLVVPVLAALADPDAYQTTAEEMQASADRIRAILQDSTGNGSIPVVEAAR